MKSQKLLIGFTLVIAVLLIPQITIASQVEPETPTVNDDDEAPFRFLHRILNLTCVQVFLMNRTQTTDGNNSTCDGECDCNPLQIRDRTQGGRGPRA